MFLPLRGLVTIQSQREAAGSAEVTRAASGSVKGQAAAEASGGVAGHALKYGKDYLQLALVVLLAFAVRSTLVDHYVIPSASMVPTLMGGDRVFVFKAAYSLRFPFTHWHIVGWKDPQRGDIIVFASPTDGTTFIKRIVGLPGETVAVKRGRLSIDGREMPLADGDGTEPPIEDLDGHPHAINLLGHGGPDFGPLQVPEGRYFMVGDNRGNSQDSRVWGFLDRDAIMGKALRIYYSSAEGFRWSPL